MDMLIQQIIINKYTNKKGEQYDRTHKLVSGFIVIMLMQLTKHK